MTTPNEVTETLIPETDAKVAEVMADLKKKDRSKRKAASSAKKTAASKAVSAPAKKTAASKAVSAPAKKTAPVWRAKYPEVAAKKTAPAPAPKKSAAKTTEGPLFLFKQTQEQLDARKDHRLRAGTRRFDSFQAIKNGMKVETYSGAALDLAHFIKNGLVWKAAK